MNKYFRKELEKKGFFEQANKYRKNVGGFYGGFFTSGAKVFGYSLLMALGYVLGGPAGGAVIGALTGLYAARKANKAVAEANPGVKQGWFKKMARYVMMMGAGAAAGALPLPFSLVTVGPAIVMADKICFAGSHPMKNEARVIGDIFGAAIPGAGIGGYLRNRNIDLVTKKLIQPVSAPLGSSPPYPAQPHAVAGHQPQPGMGPHSPQPSVGHEDVRRRSPHGASSPHDFVPHSTPPAGGDPRGHGGSRAK